LIAISRRSAARPVTLDGAVVLGLRREIEHRAKVFHRQQAVIISACANVELLDQKRGSHVIGHRDQCGCRDREPGFPREGKSDPFDQRQGLEAAGPCGLQDVRERRTDARRQRAVRVERHGALICTPERRGVSARS